MQQQKISASGVENKSKSNWYWKKYSDDDTPPPPGTCTGHPLMVEIFVYQDLFCNYISNEYTTSISIKKTLYELW